MPNEALLRFLGKRVKSGEPFECGYINHRGSHSHRRLVPDMLWFGTCPWFPGEQWLLDAVDPDKCDEETGDGGKRTFAVDQIGIVEELLR